MIGQVNYYLRLIGFQGLYNGIKGKIRKSTILMKIHHPNVHFPFYLRVPSSDVWTYEQIFLRNEYSFSVDRSPRIIVDAGANIGLASILFANRYPEAKIIAIEPEKSNMEVLLKNISPYNNIIPIYGALWHKDSQLDLVDPGVGKFGFVTKDQFIDKDKYGDTVQQIQGMTIDTIMKENGIHKIDILKIDIEGSEREVFRNTNSWIGKVDAIIIELHERIKQGCFRSFYNGTPGFDREWLKGENVYLIKKNSCIKY